MKFESHVPGGMDPECRAIPLTKYKNLEALLTDPWIMRWRETAGFPEDFIYCYSPNEGTWSKAVLMCQFTDPNGGRKWWVLGYMDEIPKLPEWEAPEEL